MYKIQITTPLGSMLLAAAEEGLVGAWFLGQRHFPAGVHSWTPKRTSLLEQAEQEIIAYLDGDRLSFSLPLAMRGTAFQRAVWAYLRTIPYAKTASYGHIAQALARPSAARAVGAAVGRNPFTLIVPCHRVVSADGAMTGYAAGIERKQRLIALEASSVRALQPAKRASQPAGHDQPPGGD